LRCRECGATYDVMEYREELTEELEEALSSCRADLI
jgi:hypothetical protein